METMFELPVESVEGVVLFGAIQVSAEIMMLFLEKGIPVTWLSHTGRFFGRLESTAHVNVFRQEKQILLQDSSFFLALARKIVAAKTHNQLTVLRRYNWRAQLESIDNSIKTILSLWKEIFKAENSNALMGYEGIIAKEYFYALGKLMPPEFSFKRRSKRPPLDPVNSMLSFGYTLLMYEFFTAIEIEGLQPYFGFWHSLKNHHPALASDLMEEWRAPIVDSFVLSLISHHEILAEHFCTVPESDGIFLTREGRRIFLNAYEKKLRTVNKYQTASHSYRHTLRQQTAKFAQALMAEDAGIYEPVYLR